MLSNLLHTCRSVTYVLTGAFLLLAMGTFAQSGKGEKGVVQQPVKERYMPDERILPSYFKNYASGGKFRENVSFDADFADDARRIIGIPVLIIDDEGGQKSYQLWKDVLLSLYADKKDQYAGMQKEDAEQKPTLIAVNPDMTAIVEKQNLSDFRSVVMLPGWVAEIVKDETEILKLYSSQLRAGNVLYCDSKTFAPLMITNPRVSSMEDITEEANQYYKIMYEWAQIYPQVYLSIADPNFILAVRTRNIPVLDRIGFYTYALNQERHDRLKFIHESYARQNQP